MHNAIDVAVGMVTLAAIIAANSLWYYVKFRMARRGYPTSFWWYHFNDLSTLNRISVTAATDRERREARRLLHVLYWAVVVGLTGCGGFAVIAFRQAFRGIP